MQTEKIWNQFRDELFHFVLSRVKNVEVSEDILQDVFVKIHLNIGSLKSQDRLTGWLYQITRNAIIDYFRKSKPNEALPDLPQEQESNVSYLDFEKCILGFVAELPEKYRQAIVKTELGHLSQKEFAKEIGISYSGAKSRVQRAKEELKELFVACCGIKKPSNKSEIDFKDPEDCSC